MLENVPKLLLKTMVGRRNKVEGPRTCRFWKQNACFQPEEGSIILINTSMLFAWVGAWRRCCFADRRMVTGKI